MVNYENVIIDYINAHNITKENVDNVIKSVGYITFFNDITVGCLGQPKTVHKKRQQTTSAIVYLPDLVKERLITNFSIVYVSNLYYGIMSNGFIKFNYETYPLFLEILFNLRKELKTRILEGESDEHTELVQFIIKIYMNVVYGMLDNATSVLSSEMYNPREYVVTQSIKVLLEVISFFFNKSCPLYHINIDDMFVPYVDDNQLIELKKHFKKNAKSYINTKVSSVDILEQERNLTGYIKSKRKMIYGPADTMTVNGLRKVDDQKLLIENKKYFGRNHRDIFPEYAIWG